MSRKTRPSRDVHGFSLRGLSTINPFGVVPAVGDDRINKTIDDRMKRAEEEKPDNRCIDRPSWRRDRLRLLRRAV